MPTRPSVGVSINLISSSLLQGLGKLKRLLSRISLDDAQDVRAVPHAEADRVDHLRSPWREPWGEKDAKFAPSFGSGKAGVSGPLIWINSPASDEQNRSRR